MTDLTWPRQFAIDFATATEGDVIVNADIVENGLDPQFLGWTLVRGPEFVDERRWGNMYEFIVMSPDGRYWSGVYTLPDEGAGDSYSDEDVDLREVRSVEKTVIEYVAVK